MELIKITEHNGKSAVSARELHSFLEVKERFTQWIERMFEYGFLENVDYQSLSEKSEKPKGGRPTIEYALSIDCAKEISMIQRSDKGKQARQYFIECENNLKQIISKPRSHKEVILSELRLLEENEKLHRENGRLNERTQFVDVVFKSDDLLTISQASKALNLGKTILGKKIIRTHLSKVTDWNVNREFIRGHILLEKGVFIQVSKGKYFIVIDGQKKGAILKTSPAFRKMKIVIAKAFKSYRKGSKGGQMHHVGYWKSRVIDGMHNCNLFRNSEIRFSENKSNFLKLAS